MAKLPILSFDIGAVGDRIKQDDLGWTIDFDLYIHKILDKIASISQNKEEYISKKNNFENYKFKNVEEMQDYYEKLYANTDAKCEFANIYNYKNSEKSTTIFDFEQYQGSYGHVVHRYEMMRKSKLWKIAKTIKKTFKRN